MSNDDPRGRGEANAPQMRPNPALEPLAALRGDWEMELSNAAFLPNPTDIVKGSASFEWAQDGAFLVLYMGDRPTGKPNARWLIGRDEASHEYTVLYYDARTLSRVYMMSFADRVWKMWRQAPGFWQRFEGTVSEDGRTITAHWEKSPDGATWEHDFDVRYRKVD